MATAAAAEAEVVKHAATEVAERQATNDMKAEAASADAAVFIARMDAET
jgi:hypothetical protein